MRGLNKLIVSGIILTVLLLLTFIILQGLQLPVGRFIDWVIGIATFWWLLIIVTFPWNIHFQAREVVFEATISMEKNIPIKPKNLDYAKKWVKWSLIIAIALHLISAIGLYALAVSGISSIGYLGSGAALLLTVLRPVMRAYKYIAARLAAIQREFLYPREDIVKLRQDVKDISKKVKALQTQLNTENEQSWATKQEARLAGMGQEINRVWVALNEQRTTNQSDHARLSREAEHAIAQISADGQFLDHVREIIRFVKSA